MRSLEGQLIWHDNLRGWFELHTGADTCGTEAVELVPWSDDNFGPVWKAQRRALEELRGCRVKTQGVLNIPETGYYSSTIYQTPTLIEPIGVCERKKPLPDFSHAKPQSGLRRYDVTLTFDYGAGKPLVGYVTGGGRRFGPWQAYASYDLTGGFVLYTYCAKGFGATTFSGAQAAKPWLIDGYLTLDPEGAAGKHVTHLAITYSCVKGAS